MAPRHRTFLLLPLLACLSVPAAAQNQEIEAARRRVAELVEKGRALEEQGKRDQAHALFQEAEALERRIAGSRPDRPDRGPGQDAERILHGLELGMESLRRLRRMDALHMLEKVTAEYRRELEASRQRGPGRDRPPSEVEHARHEVEVLELARAATREAENERLTKLLDHAIRARKVALEGRRDAEARKIRETAPSAGNVAEVLIHCAELYQRWGKKDRADMCRGLGEAYLARAREQRRERGESREERERERAEERERGEHERAEARERREHERAEGRERREREHESRDAGDARIRELEAQIRELGEAIRKLQEQIRRTRR